MVLAAAIVAGAPWLAVAAAGLVWVGAFVIRRRMRGPTALAYALAPIVVVAAVPTYDLLGWDAFLLPIFLLSWYPLMDHLGAMWPWRWSAIYVVAGAILVAALYASPVAITMTNSDIGARMHVAALAMATMIISAVARLIPVNRNTVELQEETTSGPSE